MAEDVGTAKSIRPDVFISYAHEDAAYLNRLITHLTGVIKKEQWWADTHIEPGRQWLPEIQNALQSARLAIVLVSANSLASEFIRTQELPAVLKRVSEEKIRIIVVLLEPCLFAKSPLNDYQAVNSPDTWLCNLPYGEQEAIWQEVAAMVSAELEPLPLSLNTAEQSAPNLAEVTPAPADVRSKRARLLALAAGGVFALALVSTVAYFVEPSGTSLNNGAPEPFSFGDSGWIANWSALNCGEVRDNAIQISRTCIANVPEAAGRPLQDVDLVVLARFPNDGDSLRWISRLQDDGVSGYEFAVTRSGLSFACEGRLVENGRDPRALTTVKCDDRPWEPALLQDGVFRIQAQLQGDSFRGWLTLGSSPSSAGEVEQKLCREFAFGGTDNRYPVGAAALLPAAEGRRPWVELWRLRKPQEPDSACQ